MNQRIQSIDALRGLAMIFMALDHTRDFFSNFAFSPTDLSHTTVLLFLIRWITHFCAPIFVFLIGTSMYIRHIRGNTPAQLAWFLFTRGLWMIVVEFTIVNLAWTFNPSFSSFAIQIIAVIGCGMIVLSALVFLPMPFIFIVGAVLVAGHNLLDGKESVLLGDWAWIHLPTPQIVLPGLPHITIAVFYSLIPWIGVPALGYVFGYLFSLGKQQRFHWMLIIGCTCISLFIILRAFNIYGDPIPWSVQKNLLFTILSFINCNKYPPSLLYFLMTLGPSIILLGILEQYNNALIRFLVVFGKVPFFYYVIHLYIIHSLIILFAYIKYGQASWLYHTNVFSTSQQAITAHGFGIQVTILVWISVVIILYPLCYWYGKFKAKHKDNVLLTYL